MIQLPDDVRSYLETVRGQYLACYRDAIAQAVKRAAGPGSQVLAECEMSAEGGDGTPVVLDLCEVAADGSVLPERIIHRSFSPRGETIHQLADARLKLCELVWFTAALIGGPVRDLAFFDDWFAAWRSASSDRDLPLSGRVHFLDVERRDDMFVASIDLGSAPVEAVRDLIARAIAAGATSLSLLSPAEALAGEASI